MPVLNGGQTLRRSIGSLLAQTFQDFRIIISDNASTDDTSEICREFAAADPRIEVLRRAEQVSAIENFRGLVAAASTPYFMFAPADDVWDPTFMAQTLAALEADPNASLACPKVELISANGRGVLSSGTYALEGPAESRLRKYLRDPGDNSRFYGIHRTAEIQAGFQGLAPIVAFDWIALVPGLLAGTHIEIPEVLLRRDRTAPERYRDWVTRLEPNPIGRIFPNLRMALTLLPMLPLGLRLRLLPELAAMCILSTANSPYAAVRRSFAVLRRLRINAMMAGSRLSSRS